jgi:hypothetical protein
MWFLVTGPSVVSDVSAPECEIVKSFFLFPCNMRAASIIRPIITSATRPKNIHYTRTGRARCYTAARPWFVDVNDEPVPSTSRAQGSGFVRSQVEVKLLPPGVPDYLKRAHSHLAQSPLLDLSTLTVSKPLPSEFQAIVDLPTNIPTRRLSRIEREMWPGRGIEVGMSGGIWDWVLVAQVKEGTEGRGAIESVAFEVRNMVGFKFRMTIFMPYDLILRVS